MNSQLEGLLLKTFQAESILAEELIQNLWSDYGQILRVRLQWGSVNSIIVKNIITAQSNQHPRGWNTNNSHLRKVKSYEVETNWYNNWSNQCNELCKVPKCLLIEQLKDEQIIVLEDLNDVGFDKRKSYLSLNEVKLGLNWLANFHATFLNEKPEGLWELGTYWHLDTRPDELNEMGEGPLKNIATKLDRVLSSCKYKTFVHGDAKVANFCFDDDNNTIAAVDFQYVGGGCGMKDVVYFLGSCLTEEECELYEKEVLNYYFKTLKEALSKTDKQYSFSELEKEWREMYAVAWVDFMRFLMGWAPTHQKINGYSRKLMDSVISTFS